MKPLSGACGGGRGEQDGPLWSKRDAQDHLSPAQLWSQVTVPAQGRWGTCSVCYRGRSRAAV